MRLLITSDWHLDAITDGFVRRDDLQECLEQLLDFMARHPVDHFLFLGDLCDPDTPRTLPAIVQAMQFAKRLECPSWWLVGNHDVIEAATPMSTLDPINELPGCTVIDRPMSVVINRASDHQLKELVFLPYTSRARHYDAGEFLTQSWKPHLPVGDIVFCGHLNIDGMHPGSESRDMARGRPMMLPIPELSMWSGATVFNGHYHNRVSLNRQGVAVHIPGTLDRLRHDEEHHTPSFLVYDDA